MEELLRGVLAMFAMLVLNAPAAAAVNMYVKFPEIEGNSTARGHEGWIEVLSYSWGVSKPDTPGTGGGQGNSKPIFDDFTITKLTDVSTPKLFESIVQGKHLATGTLNVLSTASDPRLLFEISFEDVLLTDLSFQGAASGFPTESVSFVFGKASLTYYPVDAAGRPLPPVTSSWDIARAVPAPEASTQVLFGLGTPLLLFAVQRRQGPRRRSQFCIAFAGSILPNGGGASRARCLLHQHVSYANTLIGSRRLRPSRAMVLRRSRQSPTISFGFKIASRRSPRDVT